MASNRARGRRFIASSSPQSPPFATTGTPLTDSARLSEPGKAYVILRIPNETSRASETAPATEKLRCRRYRFWGPYPFGHQSRGFLTRKAGVIGGLKAMVRVSCGARETFSLKLMCSIVPVRTPDWALSVTLRTVAWTVRSAVSVRGSGKSEVMAGSGRTTGPLADSTTSCQMPASRSRMVGIQSQPMLQRNVGPSRPVTPPFGPVPVATVFSWVTPGCGWGKTCTASPFGLPTDTFVVTSKMPRANAPWMGPTCRPLTHTSAR